MPAPQKKPLPAQYWGDLYNPVKQQGDYEPTSPRFGVSVYRNAHLNKSLNHLISSVARDVATRSFDTRGKPAMTPLVMPSTVKVLPLSHVNTEFAHPGSRSARAVRETGLDPDRKPRAHAPWHREISHERAGAMRHTHGYRKGGAAKPPGFLTARAYKAATFKRFGFDKTGHAKPPGQQPTRPHTAQSTSSSATSNSASTASSVATTVSMSTDNSDDGIDRYYTPSGAMVAHRREAAVTFSGSTMGGASPGPAPPAQPRNLVRESLERSRKLSPRSLDAPSNPRGGAMLRTFFAEGTNFNGTPSMDGVAAAQNYFKSARPWGGQPSLHMPSRTTSYGMRFETARPFGSPRTKAIAAKA